MGLRDKARKAHQAKQAEVQAEKERERQERRLRQDARVQEATDYLRSIIGNDADELELKPGMPWVYAYLDQYTRIGIEPQGDHYVARVVEHNTNIHRDDLVFASLEELGEILSRQQLIGNEYDDHVEVRYKKPLDPALSIV